jgi:hypothetical protein
VTHLRFVDLEVSTQPLLGQDGTLANDFQQETTILTESDAFPGMYRGTSMYVPDGFWWDSTPGIYFWQVSATEYQTAPPFEIVHYVSPTYSLTITAEGSATTTQSSSPSPGPVSLAPPSGGTTSTMSLAEAYEAVKGIIRLRTGHYARRLKDHCVKEAQTSSVCSARWVAPLPLTARTWIYAGRFELEAEGESVNYAFRGARAEWRCIRRHGVRACARVVHW